MSRMLVITALFALAGCVSSGTKVTEQQAGQFEKGKSTEADVIARLGPPSTVIRQSDGSHIDQYTHIDSQARAASFIPVVGLMAGGADSKMSIVSFTFTPDGLLKDWTSTQNNTGVNTGLLNQQ
jgi:outer membrane protein assembly factor BamE (lipoprotein component of BamABCDE complex)